MGVEEWETGGAYAPWVRQQLLLDLIPRMKHHSVLIFDGQRLRRLASTSDRLSPTQSFTSG